MIDNEEEPCVHLTRTEMQDIVKTTVIETLTHVGVDASDPVEMQKDFNHLREWRIVVNDVRKKSILTILGLLLTGVLAFIWIGFKISVGK